MTPKEQTPDAQTYKCEDCGTDINEGEFKTFGICDDCWDKHHKKVQPPNSNEDEGFKKLVIDTFHELYPYSSGPHLNELFILAERISKYERAKQAELVAENERLKDELKDSLNQTQIDYYENKIENLVRNEIEVYAENARLKAECSSHEKERYEIYSFDSSQAMEIKALQKELEQLRSELDKMREALKISKSWVSQITNVYLEEGRDKIVSIIESALSGGSKQ